MIRKSTSAPSHPFLLLLAASLTLTLSALPGRAQEMSAEKSATEVQGGTQITSEGAQTVLSPVYEIDRKYKSMQGPYSQQTLTLGESKGIKWITGFDAVMVGPDGSAPRAQEFMCHSNLDIGNDPFHRRLRFNPGFSSRLFTLSQGQVSIEFPEGFGIPVAGDEDIQLTTQVLNHNLEGKQVEVRHKVTLHYVEDKPDKPMKALFPVGAYGLALLEGEQGYFGIAQGNAEMHGPGCLPGQNASSHTYTDNLGQKFTGHWVVPPGRQVNHTLVTHLMRLPYDTTVHYIAVHLHPFAESLELRDLTTKETVFKSAARNFEGRIGLAEVQSFSSEEGIPVYKNHEYELVSVYNNTSDQNQDSMAVMYIYLRDLRAEGLLAQLRKGE